MNEACSRPWSQRPRQAAASRPSSMRRPSADMTAPACCRRAIGGWLDATRCQTRRKERAPTVWLAAGPRPRPRGKATTSRAPIDRSRLSFGAVHHFLHACRMAGRGWGRSGGQNDKVLWERRRRPVIMVSRPRTPGPPGAARADRHTQTLGLRLVRAGAAFLHGNVPAPRHHRSWPATLSGLARLGTDSNARALPTASVATGRGRKRRANAITGSCSPGYSLPSGLRGRAPNTKRRRRFAVVCQLGGPNPSLQHAETANPTPKSEDAVNDGMLP